MTMTKEFTTRFNVMTISSMHAFANIRGGLNNGCKDVYFYRFLGVGGQYVEAVREMDQALGHRHGAGEVFYKRLLVLPRIGVAEELAPYIRMYEDWVSSGQTRIAFPSVGNDRFFTVLNEACKKVLALYQQVCPQCSESQKQNFMIKLLFWLEHVAGQSLTTWNERILAKLVVQNVSKKQEYLFCYFLALLGFDVLLLQHKMDIDPELDRLGLSGTYVLGSFADCSMPDPEDEMPQVSNGQELSRQQPRRQVMRAQQAQGEQPLQAQGEQCPQAEVPPSGRPRLQLPPRNRARHADAPQNIGGPVLSGQQPDREKTYEELALLSSSVVMIAIHNQNGDVTGTGSGIMISTDGYILTNNHVASGGVYYSVKVEDDDQVYQTHELIKYNPDLDLAVIRIDRQLKPLHIYKGKNKLVRGQRVVAIGSPLGLFNSISDGIIAGFRTIDKVDMIQFTAPISHGSSGGAVLNMYGEVVGISTAGFDDGQNINLAVGYECIRTFANPFISTK